MIKDAPQRIFLQMGFDENEEFPETVTFDELEGVTWSDDRLNDTDLAYIRIEEYARLREALEELIQLRDWKDRNGKDEHYLKARDLVWSQARQALKGG